MAYSCVCVRVCVFGFINRVCVQVGNILISINPYKRLPLYTEEMVQKYVMLPKLTLTLSRTLTCDGTFTDAHPCHGNSSF